MVEYARRCDYDVDFVAVAVGTGSPALAADG